MTIVDTASYGGAMKSQTPMNLNIKKGALHSTLGVSQKKPLTHAELAKAPSSPRTR